MRRYEYSKLDSYRQSDILAVLEGKGLLRWQVCGMRFYTQDDYDLVDVYLLREIVELEDSLAAHDLLDGKGALTRW